MTIEFKHLRVPALRIKQGPNRQLFSLAIEGKQITDIASISRIKRGGEKLLGYQRPEVQKHILEIQRYIESSNPMIPNPVIIAFDNRVYFEPANEQNDTVGYLVIPVSDDNDFQKPGFIVDGQQRTAALRDAQIQSFVMPVSAFITDNDADQREQFMLVNSTKPLPKTLLHELAPYTEGRLPSDLQARKFPSLLTQRLNYGEGPLKGKIKTATNPTGIIADTSIIKMIEGSLKDGALYHFRDPETGMGDETKMIQILNNFWTAVSLVFTVEWALPPRQSRLLHGVGIASLGALLDEIYDSHHGYTVGWDDVPTVTQFEQELLEIKPICNWSKGVWDFGVEIDGTKISRKWNDLQNLSKDISLVTDYLVNGYRVG
ncbi:DGQHR domain-containing protein DpdB [Shewanella xiamenensis]|uniref:DGQHR domain-containing protein DpdB n=1 Tax=Shewanella xiamenensis TaxID=332186 RepID=A0AAE4PWL9_9GAMM|nr:DGQHR domain-containing protein DpdB [Shewanella xiamenensis]MCT8862411.1 DGQHR domain-containing protein [Shewanella xiamenensis]MDH1315020.1 DGQHR domain-containing protein DpdB [Shewanella xiamenensis]MDV5390001.1 DGQHR domain-containing protein DpdB [Shewanella xiamenensis]